MKRIAICVLLGVLIAISTTSQAQNKPASRVKYGSNKAAGKTFTHDGVKLYYETYGTGKPLLMVHGNGGSIADMTAQIDHFRKRYKVIAMDSRDHGRSADSNEQLTYEEMADDLAALLDHLKVGPVYVLGGSDGGIEALLLGIRHPEKVSKIAAMAANLNPGNDAFLPEVTGLIRTMVDQVPAAERETPACRRSIKVTSMMFDHPNIPLTALNSIKVPTLVLAGDHDLIRDEHTVAIFQHIPNSQLAIFPNATHMILYDDPALFNSTIDRFFNKPFVKIDRIGDTMKSLEKLRSGH